MSKKERIKTMLNALIAVIVVFLTTLFGVFGFAAMQYKALSDDNVLLWSVVAGVGFLVFGLAVFVKWFFKELKRLEKMK